MTMNTVSFVQVREVRTNDDTMIEVKLMIFYELQDILRMLEATHDPIADMIKWVVYILSETRFFVAVLYVLTS